MAQKQATGVAQPNDCAVDERDIPEAAENCLVGMTFVFTGVLPTLSREKCKEIVQNYGGKVTTAPSGKTTCIVLGQDAGPSKIEKIIKLGTKTIDEDGFIQLLESMPANGGSGEAAQKAREKKELEMRLIEEEVQREIIQEKAEKAAKAEREAQAFKAAKAAELARALELASTQTTASKLWTSKYAPKSFMQFSGNKTAVERLRNWLKNWDANQKSGFLRLGPDGSGKFRAVIMHGPPGIGKTTAAHLAAKEAGYDVIESNASDTRSKGLLADKVSGILANTSISGFFASEGKAVDKTKKKICVIMDEVDGMSSGDRGGVGQMAALCKTTNVPIILICNERRLPKMKPFDNVAFDITFRRLDVNQARARMMTIAIKEGIKIPPNVLDNLIMATGSDLRQVINMLSTFARTEKNMDFDQSKDMGKAWEKNVILKPFDIASKLLAGSTFSASSRMTLNDKIELYFHDHAFAPLMIQENYLSTAPARRDMCHLSLVEHAADSLSESDLVDRMIHGSEQRWSLMPFHAVMSAVRPSSFVAGGMTGRMNFNAWLGQNSKAGKLMRLLQELQSHARLKISGDRHEVRLNYLPTWTSRLTQPLIEDGQEGIANVVEIMDEYFLTREDWDSIMELGVGPTSGEVAIKAISSTVKSAFTRKYNAASHPVPFMKSATTGAFSGGKLASKDVPDLDDVIEDDVDTPNDDEKDIIDDEDDITKDKYIKMGKKPATKKAPAKKKSTVSKAKAKKQ
ncbi:DNA replication factor C, large subunit [Nadsonia fulvescens var. elongata DSM 6958]|uniref:Replication factor C subunit 1 n=1 Tax=Nadsonia fulvescens var. elongata DSM 6958 TaxID=857566 RepID=A0A1E3PH46_9ASCO|nr:DNA replication factor C, large subunit [Nadsonia fulvescens var. elongata DSM 6958]